MPTHDQYIESSRRYSGVTAITILIILKDITTSTYHRAMHLQCQALDNHIIKMILSDGTNLIEHHF